MLLTVLKSYFEKYLLFILLSTSRSTKTQLSGNCPLLLLSAARGRGNFEHHPGRAISITERVRCTVMPHQLPQAPLPPPQAPLQAPRGAGAPLSAARAARLSHSAPPL